MTHKIFKVVNFEIKEDYKISIVFDDNTMQVIDFKPVLSGEIYGPLNERSLFNQVKIDNEVKTLVWPNGADFDPETLHDWPKYKDELITMMKDSELSVIEE